MTIEKLLNCTGAELKAMTDVQLNDYFSPVFNITRPDQAAREKAATPAKTGQSSNLKSKQDMAMALLKGFGID